MRYQSWSGHFAVLQRTLSTIQLHDRPSALLADSPLRHFVQIYTHRHIHIYTHESETFVNITVLFYRSARASVFVCRKRYNMHVCMILKLDSQTSLCVCVCIRMHNYAYLRDLKTVLIISKASGPLN